MLVELLTLCCMLRIYFANILYDMFKSLMGMEVYDSYTKDMFYSQTTVALS